MFEMAVLFRSLRTRVRGDTASSTAVSSRFRHSRVGGEERERQCPCGVEGIEKWKSQISAVGVPSVGHWLQLRWTDPRCLSRQRRHSLHSVFRCQGLCSRGKPKPKP